MSFGTFSKIVETSSPKIYLMFSTGASLKLNALASIDKFWKPEFFYNSKVDLCSCLN